MSDNKDEFTFYLDGDLLQMSNQRRFLNERDIQTRQNNVYPCLRQQDVVMSLSMIWSQKCDGWWHYREKYVQYGICTEEQFYNYLQRS